MNWRKHGRKGKHREFLWLRLWKACASGGHKRKRENNIKQDLTKQAVKAGSEYHTALSIWCEQ
jgi:hypothetical protein